MMKIIDNYVLFNEPLSSFIPQELPLYNVSVTAQSDEIPKFWTILPVVYATESHV